MYLVENINEEVLDLLNTYSTFFFDQDLTELTKLAVQNPKNKPIRQSGWGTSEAYLKVIVDKDGHHDGYPEMTYSHDLQSGKYSSPESKEKCLEVSQELMSWLGARNQAVHSYYPGDGGYIGWHNNWNAHGYNIIFSYTVDGSGYFKYLDPISKEVIHMQDSPGWCCKVGYFGRGREPDKVIYHCAGTNKSPRLTIAFVIPHREIWMNMVQEISGRPDFLLPLS